MVRRSYERVQVALSQVDLAGVASTILGFMRANIATTALVFQDQHGLTSTPGCVIASPSYSGVTNQDYVHHWLRDAAITMTEIAASLDAGSGVDQTLCDYVAFSELCQRNAPPDKFFLACYDIDTTPRDWSPQKDGPALQSLAFATAWPFLDAAARTTATTVAQRNLEQTVQRWSDDTNAFGPWEDVRGPSFFARAAQIRFLDEVATTNTLSLHQPPDFAAARDGLRAALDTHWSEADGYYRSIPGGVAGSASTDTSRYDPNADVIMGALYGSVPCTDPRLLATAAKLRACFDVGGPAAYPINEDDRARGIGPMIGRYAGDTYDGDTSDPVNAGQPWAICTANLAQLHYALAAEFQAGHGPDHDPLTAPFFTRIGLDHDTVTDPTRTSTVIDALRSAGDAMLRAVLYHSDHQHLSEQFDKTTGYEKSVQDLTWSYASYLSAARTRAALRDV